MSNSSTVSASTLLSSSTAPVYKSSTVDKPDNLSYDLGNLCGFDNSPLDSTRFASDRNSYVTELGRENVQLLLNRIFSLPSEPIIGEPGRLVRLPPPSTPLPRAKPLPKPKEPTKWEKFAAAKGITKQKKGRMEWDENKEVYAPRWGFNRANNDSDQVIIEHKEGDDPNTDPWTRMRQEKKARIEKNEKQHNRNLSAASGNRLPGTIDLASAFPSKEKKTHSDKKRAKMEEKPAKKDHHVELALKVAQRSTASMGKFDSVRRGEKAVKISAGDAVHQQADVKAEKARSLNMLNKILGKSETDGERVNLNKAASVGQQANEISNKKKKEIGKKRKRNE
jgi:regulator of ribosome biosynthesis